MDEVRNTMDEFVQMVRQAYEAEYLSFEEAVALICDAQLDD